jgi:hypothetical protein
MNPPCYFTPFLVRFGFGSGAPKLTVILPVVNVVVAVAFFVVVFAIFIILP